MDMLDIAALYSMSKSIFSVQWNCILLIIGVAYLVCTTLGSPINVTGISMASLTLKKDLVIIAMLFGFVILL